MGATRRYLLTILAGLALTFGLVAPAQATVSAQVTNGQISVTISGKQPKKATLVLAGKSYKLKRAGKTWHTKTLPASVLGSAPGADVKVKYKIKGKARTQKTTIPAGNDGGNNGSAPLFAAPGVDRIGLDAWNAISGYLLNSTFTDCVQGWPNCAVEYRYGHFPNYTMASCRLTSTSGSDIINGLKPFTVIGAEQKADGSWGVSYEEDYGDGQQRFYSWYVGTDGRVFGRYWFASNPNVDPPTEEITGLVWVRGARDCSY